MRLLLPLLLLLPSIHSISPMESYERHLNDLSPPRLEKASSRGPMRVKRYKCVEEYVDLPISSTSESLSLFSHHLPELNSIIDSSLRLNQNLPPLNENADRSMLSRNTEDSFNSMAKSFPPLSANTDHSFALLRSSPQLMENQNGLIDNENDEQLQKVEADHGVNVAADQRSEEMMFFSDSAPPASKPTQPSSPPFTPQFVPPSFAISSSPFIQLPPPNTIASSRPLSQIRVPASTGRALPPPRPVQLMQQPNQLQQQLQPSVQLQRLHSGGRSLSGDRELPDLDFSMDEGPKSQPAPPSAPPLFSRPAAPAASAAPPARPLQPFFSISPTPLPPLPDFGPTFSVARDAEQRPDLLTRQSDIEDISVVPLNPSNPARGPKAIMRQAEGKRHLPLNSNEAEEVQIPREFISYNGKRFNPFNRNSTKPSFKSAEPSEKMWTFSSWKAEEV